MVDKLNPLARTALAAQLARAKRGAESARPAPRPANDASSKPTGSGHVSTAQQISRRIAAIDRDDPQRPQRAFRIFIEAQMLKEMGAGLGNEASFQQLVDDVVHVMQGDPGLRIDIDEVTERILSMS